MTQPTPRELLAQADRERTLARGANAAARNYRLGRSAIAHRKTGLLGWLTDRSKAPDPATFETLPAGVEAAIYRALGIVEREANQRADELEARVRTEASR